MHHHAPRILAILTLISLLPACTPPPAGEPLSQPQDSPAPGGGGGNPDDVNTICRAITVEGDVFYNEQRTYGRFSSRWQPGAKTSGPGGLSIVDPTKVGKQFKLAAVPTANYLGLLDATVEIVELDPHVANLPHCNSEVVYGSTTVDAFGHFTWSGNVCDDCTADDFEEQSGGRTGVSVGTRVVLRSCPLDNSGRCFEVKNPGAWCNNCGLNNESANPVTYQRYFSTASLANPKLAFAGDHITLPSMNYETIAGTFTDLDAEAANIFSEMVEVTRFLHVESNIPFYQPKYGEVEVIYPNNWDSAFGHSHESSRVCIRANRANSVVPSAWYDGQFVMHEYGHVVNYRAWDGHGKSVSYCYQNWPACDETWHTAEYTAAALKEGWAEFVWHAALEGHESAGETANPWSCGAPAYDLLANDLCLGPAPCADGQRTIENVSHALCDWFDAVDDNNPTFCKSRDHTATAMYDIWADMKGAWDTATLPQKLVYDLVAQDGGLSLCSVAAYHLNVAVPNNGVERDNLSDLLENNGIECGLRLSPTTCP